MEPMKVRNFRLPELLLEELKALSERQGIRQPEIVRRALREFIDRSKVTEIPK